MKDLSLKGEDIYAARAIWNLKKNASNFVLNLFNLTVIRII
jgi:hypothetical protein